VDCNSAIVGSIPTGASILKPLKSQKIFPSNPSCVYNPKCICYHPRFIYKTYNKKEESIPMAEITLVGWFHTILGILSIGTVIYTIAKYKIIKSTTRSGQIYLIATLITAISALTIFQNGGFNIAHLLAIATLLAVVVGWLAEKKRIVGGLSPYLQAASYSATFLFHMIPAITDGLRRLPVNDPVVTDVADPLLLGFYMAFAATYVVGVIAQAIWLRRSSASA
jgi:uncharacterized membrane protein